ncbi:seryl-tRNA synthetase [Coemansia erecta]|uniref:serine--tRNA ligase n=1 Tax=Coemansia erecta TaxID=147472 RepID=A0A9W7XZ86_9FUNG|nr:seryl-tRNA synthetase [Coemansia erecta]
MHALAPRPTQRQRLQQLLARPLRQAAQHTPSRRTLLTPSLDYKHIRDHAAQLEQNARARNVPSANPQRVGRLYDSFRSLTAQAQDLRAQLNTLSRQLSRGAATEPPSSSSSSLLREQAAATKRQVRALDAQLADVQREMQEEALRIPNWSHADVPPGCEPRVVREVGRLHLRDTAGFRDHLDVATGLGIVDLAAAARVAGSRFVFWRGAGALLELALVQWAVGRAMLAGFTPHVTPDMARASVVDACGFRPRPSATGAAAGEPSQIYRVAPEALDAPADDPLCLVATAEIPLVAMRQGQVVQVPERVAGLSHCFRAEAGARGRDTRGVYRLHQFTKVELVALTLPEHSDAELDRLVEFQAGLYADLGLTFRVLDMPMHELGASAYRKFDIEAWMPGRRAWGEVSSASNCTDFQARRLGIRVRTAAGLRFVHSLNATAVAVPRLVVAILESFQQPDGSVVVPEALRPWMLGLHVLRPVAK